MYCESCGTKLTGMEKECPECGVIITKNFLKVLDSKDPLVGMGLVIDESGSMSRKEDSVIQSINEFIQEQQKLDEPATLSIIKFSGVVKTVYDKVDLKSIKSFSDYSPGGMTALNDGIGQMISLLSKYENVIIAIITDGHENSSIEYSTSHIKELIEQKEKDGWKFMFLAQGLSEKETFQMSQSRGIQCSMASRKVETVYKSASLGAKQYRSSKRN